MEILPSQMLGQCNIYSTLATVEWFRMPFLLLLLILMDYHSQKLQKQIHTETKQKVNTTCPLLRFKRNFANVKLSLKVEHQVRFSSSLKLDGLDDRSSAYERELGNLLDFLGSFSPLPPRSWWCPLPPRSF